MNAECGNDFLFTCFFLGHLGSDRAIVLLRVDGAAHFEAQQKALVISLVNGGRTEEEWICRRNWSGMGKRN